jgi:hypothetical protein
MGNARTWCVLGCLGVWACAPVPPSSNPSVSSVGNSQTDRVRLCTWDIQAPFQETTQPEDLATWRFATPRCTVYQGAVRQSSASPTPWELKVQMDSCFQALTAHPFVERLEGPDEHGQMQTVLKRHTQGTLTLRFPLKPCGSSLVLINSNGSLRTLEVPQ